MLRIFIRKEIQDSLLNRRFTALALFSILLMPLSGMINYEYYQARKASFDSQVAEYRSEDPTPWNLRAYRAPVILSAIARGTEPYMPIYYAFSSDASAISPGNIEAQEFSTLSTFGSLDFLFLVQVVFSLLAVLLAFDMVAGEKERGTLRAVLANRVPRDSVLLGKLIGGFTVLWTTFLLGSLLLFLVLAAYNAQYLDAAVLGRIGFIFLVSSVFLAAFYTLGLMVSTFCHTTRTAIVALLLVWVILQLVVPKAGEKIAAVVLPVDSAESVRVQKSSIVEDLSQEMRLRAGQLYMTASGSPSINGAFQFIQSGSPDAERFKSEYQRLAGEYDRRERDQVREIDMNYQRQKDRQQNLSRIIALLSPASALTFFVTDAAGTGDLAYTGYREAVQVQYQFIDNTIYSHERATRLELSQEGSSLMGNFGDGDPAPLEELPVFDVPEPALSAVVRTNVWSLASLLAFLIIPFLVAYVSFLRYDVR